jgi:spore germination protein YaaH
MPIERPPASPLPSVYLPQGESPHRVKDGDDWYSVARQFHVNVAQLIAFNFKTHRPEEVNWYLRQNVGCNKATRDGHNWTFSSSASLGIIYIPTVVVVPTSTTIVHSVGT